MSKYNVLVVDDDLFFIEVILNPMIPILANQLMGTSNFLVTTKLAYNGLDGWETYQKMKPDLVFTDYEMPLMNGAQLLENIYKYEHKPKASFIVSNSTIEPIENATKLINKKDVFDLYFENEKKKLLPHIPQYRSMDF